MLDHRSRLAASLSVRGIAWCWGTRSAWHRAVGFVLHYSGLHDRALLVVSTQASTRDDTVILHFTALFICVLSGHHLDLYFPLHLNLHFHPSLAHSLPLHLDRQCIGPPRVSRLPKSCQCRTPLLEICVAIVRYVRRDNVYK